MSKLSLELCAMHPEWHDTQILWQLMAMLIGESIVPVYLAGLCLPLWHLAVSPQALAYPWLANQYLCSQNSVAYSEIKAEQSDVIQWM